MKEFLCMAKMKSDTPIDYAIFQLSPKRSRCELFVSSDGSMEKLASGLLKPFVAHLRVAEEQVASAAQSVKLEVGRRRNAELWFTKGTLERFVRFVSTPEVLELVNTFDAEMSQLEAARRIYSQGVGDHHSGGGGSSADDATKKELLRAIDVRLVAVQQDLSTACARAAAAGFDIDSVSELQLFADRFGAHRLNEACGKFLSLCETRPNLVNQWKPGPEDRAVRASYGSDMSIDDDPPSPAPRQESTTSQQSNSPSIAFPIRRTFSREPSIERDDGDRNKPNNTVTEKDDKDESSTTPESIQSSQPARRLSVQDRISLFENKQKETSGGKPVVVKPSELRRLSSDVSLSSAAAEKAVLRRWSGASDMSIDLSSEKKDVESPLYTPSSLTASQDNKVLNSNDNTTKNSSIVKPEIKVIPSISRVSDGGLREGSFNRSEQFFESSKSNSNLGSGEIDDLKDEGRGKIQSGSFISRAEHQDFSEENPKTLPGGKADGVFGIRNQGKSKLKGSHSCGELNGPHTQIAAKRYQGSPLTQSRTSGSKGDGQVEISNPGDDSESRDESATQTRFNSTRKAVGESGVFEAVAGSRIREAFASRYKGVEGDSLPSQQEIKSFGKAEVVEKKESHASKKVSSSSVSNSEDSGSQKMKFGKQGSAAALSKKVQVQRDEINFSGNTRTSFARETQEGFDSFSTPPPDQTQRMRPSKGNQELNDELKMKANELEKLFAEHKLRAPGDQSNSARKGKTEDTRREPTSNLHYKKPVEDITPQVFDGYQWAEPTESSKNKTNFNASSPVKTIDSQNYGDTLNKNFSELSVSEGSRGKVYNRYMQKRDAKLREEWSSNRVEKEARLKSMQDSLERNRSEMKTKISGSADKQDSISSSRRRAERLQSYNIRSMMIREQQHLDFGDSEDEDEALDRVCEDGALDGTSFENDMSRGAQGKKILPNNRSLLSSTPRTSAAPVPRSATKTSTINSGKRRMQPENPLAQSVPNFSDLRKENTRPSSGGSKVTRLQVRNYSRSKSISEEAMVDKATIDKEDKSHRSQSLRKSSAFPNECEEMPSLDSDGGVVLTPIKFEEEVPKSATTKPFLKKGSRTGFTARASIARQKASVGSNPIKYVEGNDYLATGPDDVVSGVKDEGDEDFETLKTEGNKILDNGEQRIELESDKFRNSGSENSDGTPTFSHVDHALGSQLPYEISSNFLPVESMQDWPGESPMSWISRNQNPFSYPHEMSDVDASVDSPVGSPASWNSHSLNQMEADAARMRKKWGTAQKPMLVNNSSNHLPRKDMTRGFKRFLKFGRKNRASESLVDWISATTSEGDDDTEDGRDLANRSSEDLRKSRMGFSQAQASDYGFSESELFGESVQSSDSSIPAPPSNFKLRDDHMSGSSIKAPRSFFSLSTFRSKGSDSKPR